VFMVNIQSPVVTTHRDQLTLHGDSPLSPIRILPSTVAPHYGVLRKSARAAVEHNRIKGPHFEEKGPFRRKRTDFRRRKGQFPKRKDQISKEKEGNRDPQRRPRRSSPEECVLPTWAMPKVSFGRTCGASSCFAPGVNSTKRRCTHMPLYFRSRAR
jgi:hypothetical protein